MTTLADLEIGNPKTVLNLMTVPLSGNSASTLEYLLVDEALEAKKVIVEEVSEGGSVPELRMTNFSNKVVLIVDGTELVGAKQNRIVNASFLIPPESVTRIPVSCVEQGRWGYKGREFGSSRHFSPHRIRRDNAEFHKTSLKEKRGYASDQGKVWAHVADMSHQMAAPTNTGAMSDVLEQRESSIEEYRKGISLDGAGTGAAFFVNGIFQGIELFDRAATFGKMFPKLLSGVAVEAMMAQGQKLSARRVKTSAEAADYVKRILAEVSKSLFEKFEPVGIGEDWRYDGKRSFGKALHYGTDLIHFSAFGK
ncbi:MAG TPA: DUF6569 family protein [Candidatus Methanoperedens sp.]|nr:DUF6569 family protein [Candidatus Methanoperedens sp.]